MQSLPLAIATLYAELDDLTAGDTSLDRREGGFSAKEINGRRYWYHQRWAGKKRVQKLVGLETPEVLDHIAAWNAAAEEQRTQQARRRQLVQSLRAAMRLGTDRLSARVLRQLVASGMFQAGAVLIGTHAYMTYGPMLGVKLQLANLRTGDIDIGAIDLAVDSPAVSFAAAVQAADQDFHIVPARPGARIPTALKLAGAEARVELLTPLASGKAWTPRVITALGFGARQAPYLGYLLEQSIDAVYLAEDGVRVRVPPPARYALHKLIVAANRDPGRQAKALKDRAQAELIAALAEDRPDDLKTAARDLAKHGRGYVSKATKTLRLMDAASREAVLPLLT
jgi:hypothetical protein